MNIQNFVIVSNPQQRGIHMYRLTSHVHMVEDLTVSATLRQKVIKILTNLKQITNPWGYSVTIPLKLVAMLKLDRGTRRMQSLCYAPLLHKWILTLRHYTQVQTNNHIQHDIYIAGNDTQFFKIFLGRGVHSKPLANLTKILLKVENYSQSMKKTTPTGQQE
jgi:hypothetical protein